jgi:putative Holliday junction resolvase
MDNDIIGLDIGLKRIGVARANIIAKLPSAIITLPNNDDFIRAIQDILSEYQTNTIVIGLPRDMHGRETDQTKYTRQFVHDNLSQYKIIWQDETLSTKQAQVSYNGGKGLDADAACVILDDYLAGL